MNKEEYLKQKSKYERDKKTVSEQLQKIETEIRNLKKEYIESNKPCNKDDRFETISYGGRKVIGEAKTFHLLADANVYINSYRSNNKTFYFSSPHGEVKVIK